MINGVLVERTVKDVVPALKTNSEGLRKVLDDLVQQYKDKQEEMEKWKVRYCAGCIWSGPLILNAMRRNGITSKSSNNSPSRFLAYISRAEGYGTMVTG
jgi:hypothetical protein